MKAKTILMPLLVTATLAGSMMAPISANASRLQDQKNNWRNLAIGAGALGVLGLANHNSTMAILGGLGAAAAGSQYERTRQEQSRRNDWRNYHRRYHHHYR